MILQQNNYNYWQFLGNVMHELGEPLHAIGGFVHLLRDDDQLPELLDDERHDLLERSMNGISRLQQLVGLVAGLSHYAMKQEVERGDRVLINDLCLGLRDEQEQEVLFKSDVPDYYAVKTNRECLQTVLRILLRQAVNRVWQKSRFEGDDHVYLIVTERGERGKLTFSVSDNGQPEPVSDLQRLFFLPAEKDARRTVERTEFLLCCRLVELLDGFLYIDPEFRDGRRVVFQVAL